MESHKLDPWPLDEGPRPKSGKSRLNLHGTILEGKSIGLNPPQKELWFEEPKMQARVPRQGSRIQFIGLAYQGKDIVFRFIIECRSLRDFGP
jgi:hypothetical protein